MKTGADSRMGSRNLGRRIRIVLRIFTGPGSARSFSRKISANLENAATSCTIVGIGMKSWGQGRSCWDRLCGASFWKWEWPRLAISFHRGCYRFCKLSENPPDIKNMRLRNLFLCIIYARRLRFRFWELTFVFASFFAIFFTALRSEA